MKNSYDSDRHAHLDRMRTLGLLKPNSDASALLHHYDLDRERIDLEERVDRQWAALSRQLDIAERAAMPRDVRLPLAPSSPSDVLVFSHVAGRSQLDSQRCLGVVGKERLALVAGAFFGIVNAETAPKLSKAMRGDARRTTVMSTPGVDLLDLHATLESAGLDASVLEQVISSLSQDEAGLCAAWYATALATDAAFAKEIRRHANRTGLADPEDVISHRSPFRVFEFPMEADAAE